MRVLVCLAITLVCTACSTASDTDPAAQFNPLAERYVKLALALGEHDEHYVDAYFGPAEWREQAGEQGQSLEDIKAAATSLAAEIRAIEVSSDDYLLLLRQDYLGSHLESLATVASIRNGETIS